MVKGFGKIVVAALLGLCFAQPAGASLEGDIRSILSRDSQKGAHFAINIVHAQTGRTIYARNARDLMIPASNMKIVTSAAALHYLGADYEFRTVVALKGKAGSTLIFTQALTGIKAGEVVEGIVECLGVVVE